MANLQINNFYLNFGDNGEVFEAEINLDYDGEYLEVQEIKGDFIDTNEKKAIEMLNKDFSQILEEADVELYSYNVDRQYYYNCSYDENQ